MPQDMDRLIAENFKAMDTDGDGVISQEEFAQHVLMTVRSEHPSSQASEGKGESSSSGRRSG